MTIKVIEDKDERELLAEPFYKRIDRLGRVGVGINYANQEALILIVKPKPEDKIKYIKV